MDTVKPVRPTPYHEIEMCWSYDQQYNPPFDHPTSQRETPLGNLALRKIATSAQ